MTSREPISRIHRLNLKTPFSVLAAFLKAVYPIAAAELIRSREAGDDPI